MTTADLTRATGLHRTTVVRFMSNERVSLSTMYQICKALDVTPCELLVMPDQLMSQNDKTKRKAEALTHIATQHAAELGHDISDTTQQVRDLMQSGRANDTRKARELLAELRAEKGLE